VEPTLWAAQLALAREHGFPSWARLKAEIERRLADPGDLLVRPVSSLAELTSIFDFVRAQAPPSAAREDRPFQELARRFQ
jgi:hypothetical protein